MATKSGDIVMIGILLKYGAHVNAQNLLDKTAKDIANLNNDIEILYMLNSFQTLLGMYMYYIRVNIIK